jgi:hypothetical protein
MSFQAEDLQEEKIEPDFDPGYPFGGSVEEYDIDRENQEEDEECDFCGSCVDNFHHCECGAELTKKQCHNQAGLCQSCARMM